MITKPRTPPEQQPAVLDFAALHALKIPALREYFLTHWDWYTLQTLTLQSSPTELEETARPHVVFMTMISRMCAKTIVNRFGYSPEKAIAQVESWLDTAYELPDNEEVQ